MDRDIVMDVAEVVVDDLDLDNPAYQEILRSLRRAYPHTPVVLELAAATAREHAALLTGCHVIYPFDMDRLVQAVIDAVTTAKHQSRAVVP